MDNLMQQFGFERKPSASYGNKLDKAAAYLLHQDWTDTSTVNRLLEMLAHLLREYDARLSSCGVFGPTRESSPNLRVVRSLADQDSISWDGREFRLPAVGVLRYAKVGIQRFDLAHLDKEIDRILANVDKDPDDAITSAKSLVESACRQVLADCNATPSSGADINDLTKLAFGHLHLLADQVSQKAKGADAIKKTLRSMVAAVNGLAEVRNLYGDPHGKPPGYKGLEPRHARLAATLAGGLATFILETHERRRQA